VGGARGSNRIRHCACCSETKIDWKDCCIVPEAHAFYPVVRNGSLPPPSPLFLKDNDSHEDKHNKLLVEQEANFMINNLAVYLSNFLKLNLLMYFSLPAPCKQFLFKSLAQSKNIF
jgi:hypothetical protein